MKGQSQGSFGIPPQIQEAAERSRAKNSQNVKKAGEPQEEVQETPSAAPEAASEAAAPSPAGPVINDELAKQMDPINVLQTLGIEFGDELLQQLIFKGFVEQNVEIIKGKLIAKFKTLTVEEFDLVDEMLAEEMNDKKMTNTGFENRRSLLILAFGVMELAGKPVCKPVLEKDKKTIDKVATAQKRREVIQVMAPAVVNLMIQKHGAMTVAFNLIAQDPVPYLKNS